MGGFCDEAQSCSSSRGGIGYFSSWMSNTNDFQNVCIFQSCQQEEKSINLANCKFILGNAILYFGVFVFGIFVFGDPVFGIFVFGDPVFFMFVFCRVGKRQLMLLSLFSSALLSPRFLFSIFHKLSYNL